MFTNALIFFFNMCITFKKICVGKVNDANSMSKIYDRNEYLCAID